jgi:hypothetical protein
VFTNQANQSQGLGAILLHPPDEILKDGRSNSKLLNSGLDRNPVLVLLGGEETILHRLGPQQRGRFPAPIRFRAKVQWAQ